MGCVWGSRHPEAGAVRTWVFMLVKTSQNRLYRLPLVGELADRSIAEQR
jgi:uncharacterized membrane protein